MSSPSPYNTLMRGWHTVVVYALLGAILALLLSFLQPLKYSARIRLLVLQDTGASTDAYTASRSEERIAENLATIIYTTTFFDSVIDSGFGIDKQLFPSDDYKQRREWGKTVSATVSRGTGLLTVTAYHQSVDQAEQIARAVGFVLIENASQYTSGSNITVRIVDAPLRSRWPVKPNIAANAFSGFVLGGLIGVGYVLTESDRLRRRYQFVHEEE